MRKKPTKEQHDRAMQKQRDRRARLKAQGRRTIRKPAPKRIRKGDRAPRAGTKSYRLVAGPMPETPKEGTTGRAILQLLKGAACTAAEVKAALPAKVSPVTVQKYLYMFEAAGVVTSQPAA